MAKSKFKAVLEDESTGKRTIRIVPPNSLCGHQFIQSTPSSIWTFTHPFQTRIIKVDCFVNNILVFPEIKIVDDETIELRFGEDTSGFANILFFTPLGQCPIVE